jgi:hypothetical protein
VATTAPARTGAVKDFRTLARLGHVSPARISQIISLLHLAPDIQEVLLFRTRPERGRDCLGLRQVLPLTKVLHWHQQRRLWRGLCGQGLNVAATGANAAFCWPAVSVVLQPTVCA